MSEIKIFVTHTPNQNRQRIKNPLYYHVTAGSDFQQEETVPEMLKDNTGDHISFKNKSYCELTTQYWAWKNQKADYYGFCHYRRYFSFAKEEKPVEDCGCLVYPCLSEQVQEELGLEEETMREKIEGYDFLIAQGIDTRALMADNVSEHYKKAPELHEKDLDIFQNIIGELYPDLAPAAARYLKGKKFYPCNMFIMKREIFETYSEILFRILEEFEQRVDMERYSREGYRTPGHLGERMTGIYYEYLKEKGGYRLGELQMALIEHTECTQQAEAEDSQAVPVVLAANQNYVPVLFTCLSSILLHISQLRSYHFYIFHTDIGLQSQTFFQKELQRENVKITFCDVTEKTAGRHLKGKQHITAETYYRFLILDILKSLPRVIYLDCDMIIRRDIAELYDADLENNWIGGVIDPDFAGQCNGANSDTADYAADVLHLKDPVNYLQAGVLVLDIEKLKEHVSVEKLFEMADQDIYIYSDQDIINIECQDHIKFLSMNWNVLTDAGGYRWKHVIKSAPYQVLDAYEEARKDPYIIHYAGAVKPWKEPEEDFAQEFWRVARQTAYYEILLKRMQNGGQTRSQSSGKLAGGIKNAVKRLLPKGSRIRKFIYTLYWKMK